MFTEVEFLSGAPLDEKAASLVEMPAVQTFEKLKEWQKRRMRGAVPALHPGSELVRRIYGLQPLQRLQDPDLASPSMGMFRARSSRGLTR